MLAFLPTLNAILNATCGMLLIIGTRYIKTGYKEIHKKIMITAFSVSVLFLISYLTYHAIHGTTKFMGEGILRPVYFTILISHTILAAAVPPLAIISLRYGLKDSIDKHRRIARWTYPVWLYVSVTGVIVYIMLYHL
ncbi:MAG: DUF420 domain-containing protein [Bacteroidota bacterium]